MKMSSVITLSPAGECSMVMNVMSESVCPWAMRITQEPLVQTSLNALCTLPVALAWSYSGRTAVPVCYVLCTSSLVDAITLSYHEPNCGYCSSLVHTCCMVLPHHIIDNED